MRRAAAALGVALALAGRAGASGTECGRCHEKAGREWEGSAHAEHGVSCRHCHGGDPEAAAKEAGHAQAAGFRGRLDKAGWARACAECHADPRRMGERYRMTDQFDQWSRGVHGAAVLGRKDAHAPACPDCHDGHRILSPEDPASTVFILNVPATCGKCHAAPRDEYRRGPHDVAAHRPEDPARIAPCHACHGNHRVEEATPELLVTACKPCHAASSPAAARGAAFRDEALRAGQAVERAGREVELARSIGMPIAALEEALASSDADVKSIGALQHAMEATAVGAKAGAATDRATATAEAVARARGDREARRRWIPLVWAIAALGAAPLWRKRRALRRAAEGRGRWGATTA